MEKSKTSSLRPRLYRFKKSSVAAFDKHADKTNSDVEVWNGEQNPRSYTSLP